MIRVIIAAIVVFGVVAVRMIVLPEDSLLGMAITAGTALAFVGFGFRHALRRADGLE